MEADTAKRIFGTLYLYFDDQKVLSAKMRPRNCDILLL